MWHYDEVVNGYFREKGIRSLVGVLLLPASPMLISLELLRRL